MDDQQLYRLSAFADPSAGSQGGNPAGVWLGNNLPDDATMQAVAAEVGFSETAFVVPVSDRVRTVRYFSPQAEVPFCGHATVAAGAVLGRLCGAGEYRLQTRAGDVDLDVQAAGPHFRVTLTSVLPRQAPVARDLLQAVLTILDWQRDDLDPQLPVVRAFAGAWHLVLAVRRQERLASLDYNMSQLRSLMLAHDLTTLQLVWRERPDRFHSRNPFPVGGVREDPATGAAAAALGGYLRDAGLITTPASLVVLQGQAIGRPGIINVDIPPSGGIRVSGLAVDW